MSTSAPKRRVSLVQRHMTAPRGRPRHGLEAPMRHLRLALLPLLLSTGCSMEAPTAPAVVGPVALGTPAIQAIPSGAIVRSVTGTGHFTSAAGFWRTFSYAAREHADGSVSGMFEINLRGVGARAHGRVTCMGVEGNAAWLGGVIEQVVERSPIPLSAWERRSVGGSLTMARARTRRLTSSAASIRWRAHRPAPSCHTARPGPHFLRSAPSRQATCRCAAERLPLHLRAVPALTPEQPNPAAAPLPARARA
jgi:hypothetical protein